MKSHPRHRRLHCPPPRRRQPSSPAAGSSYPVPKILPSTFLAVAAMARGMAVARAVAVAVAVPVALALVVAVAVVVAVWRLQG
jgi:hypothetical protein